MLQWSSSMWGMPRWGMFIFWCAKVDKCCNCKRLFTIPVKARFWLPVKSSANGNRISSFIFEILTVLSVIEGHKNSDVCQIITFSLPVLSSQIAKKLIQVCRVGIGLSRVAGQIIRAIMKSKWFKIKPDWAAFFPWPVVFYIQFYCKHPQSINDRQNIVSPYIRFCIASSGWFQLEPG